MKQQELEKQMNEYKTQWERVERLNEALVAMSDEAIKYAKHRMAKTTCDWEYNSLEDIVLILGGTFDE